MLRVRHSRALTFGRDLPRDDFEVFEDGMKQTTRLHGGQGRWQLRNSAVTPR
jgi:hypothetical protein